MSNDNWQTPQWLFNWLNRQYGPFDVDLAASHANHKLSNYYSLDHDALSSQTHWRNHSNGFCNPPYSNLKPWLEKAVAEQLHGFRSTWVLPAWNGERFWRDTVFKCAAEVTLIFGRVAFINPVTGQEIPGNRAGTIIAHFAELAHVNGPVIKYALRDEIRLDAGKG